MTAAPADLRNTNPPLTGTGRIGATAAVTAVGAVATGQLIVGIITEQLIRTSIAPDLIGTPATAHEIIATFSEGLVTVRPAQDSVIARAFAEDISDVNNPKLPSFSQRVRTYLALAALSPASVCHY